MTKLHLPGPLVIDKSLRITSTNSKRRFITEGRLKTPAIAVLSKITGIKGEVPIDSNLLLREYTLMGFLS